MQTASKSAILGISALYHDSGVAIVAEDGEILFAAHEERYTRIKHDQRIPHSALKAAHDFCEKNAIVVVEAFYFEDPQKKLSRQAFNLGYIFAAKAPKFKELYQQAIQKSDKKTLQLAVQNVFGPNVRLQFEALHHQSHAASSYYTSGYDHALTLVLDGVGEWETSSAYICKGKDIKKVWHKDFPHGLGLFYSAMTQLCGFKVNTGEYKLMGLAPYGEPKYADLIRKEILREREAPEFFELNLRYFSFLEGNQMISNEMLELFDLTEIPKEGQQQKVHLDIAASAQKVLEQFVASLTSYFSEEYNERNLCLAGGVALNCVNNSKLANLSEVDNIYIQPAAGDAGSALGAALLGASKNKNFNLQKMPVPYLGTRYEQKHVIQALKSKGITNYQHFDDQSAFIEAVATLLQERKIGGWFHGRSEFGPRSLGARSIIARADGDEMQTRVNLNVKYRESFRPFAPIVLKEDAAQIFEDCDTSPFMLRVYPVKNCEPAGPLQQDDLAQEAIIAHLKKTRSTYVAITHVDGSARVQTVTEENGAIHELLKIYKAKIGTGILINTSFNVRGEPIVESPLHAIDCFLGTEIDFLAIENILVLKQDVDTALLDSNYKNKYSLD